MKSTLGNSIFTLVFDVANRFSWTILMIMITRKVGESGAGAFTLSNNYIFLLLPITFWGLDQLLIRDVSADQTRALHYYINFFVIRLVLASSLWFILATLIMFFHPYQASTVIFIVIMAGALISETLNNLNHTLLVTLDKGAMSAGIAVIIGGIKTASGVFFIIRGESLITIAMMYIGIGWLQVIVNTSYVCSVLKCIKINIDTSFCKYSLRTAFPFVPIGLLIATEAQIGSLMLSFMHSEEVVGIYAIANTIIAALALIPQAIRVGVFPVLVRTYAQNNSLFLIVYRRLWRYLAWISLPLTYVVILLSRQIIGLIYGKILYDAAVILSLLAPALIFYFLNIPAARLMIIAEKQNQMAIYFLLSTGINVLLSLIGIFVYGAIGAAIARILSMSLLFILNNIYIYRNILHVSPWRFLNRILLAAGFMVLVVIIPFNYSLEVRTLLGLIIYAFASFKMKVLTHDK